MLFKSKAVISILIASVIAIGMEFLYTTQAPEPYRSGTKTALETAGETCDAIAEKSVANLTAVVAFQKLEIYGRKINVMRRCMKDQGFVENALWLNALATKAKQLAAEQHISLDEALENLKRQAMYQFKAPDQQPLYWVRSTPSN